MALTAEQLAVRHTKVWASDVATIMGLNPYKTAHQLGLEYLGILGPDQRETEAMHFGNLMEEPIGQMYMHRTGKKLRRKYVELKSEKYPWLGGHVDFIIEGEKRPLECKNVTWRLARNWGEPGSDEVAEYYLPQPATYCMLIDSDAGADVAAYFGGDDLRIYHVARNQQLEELIAFATHSFWFDFIQKGEPPPLDHDHATSIDLLKRRFTETPKDSFVDFGADIEHWHHVKRDADKMIERYTAVRDGARAHILEAMGNSVVGYLPDGTAYTRKPVKREAYTVEASEYITLNHVKKAPPRP